VEASDEGDPILDGRTDADASRPQVVDCVPKAIGNALVGGGEIRLVRWQRALGVDAWSGVIVCAGNHPLSQQSFQNRVTQSRHRPGPAEGLRVDLQNSRGSL